MEAALVIGLSVSLAVILLILILTFASKLARKQNKDEYDILEEQLLYYEYNYRCDDRRKARGIVHNADNNYGAGKEKRNQDKDASTKEQLLYYRNEDRPKAQGIVHNADDNYRAQWPRREKINQDKDDSTKEQLLYYRNEDRPKAHRPKAQGIVHNVDDNYRAQWPRREKINQEKYDSAKEQLLYYRNEDLPKAHRPNPQGIVHNADDNSRAHWPRNEKKKQVTFHDTKQISDAPKQQQSADSNYVKCVVRNESVHILRDNEIPRNKILRETIINKSSRSNRRHDSKGKDMQQTYHHIGYNGHESRAEVHKQTLQDEPQPNRFILVPPAVSGKQVVGEVMNQKSKKDILKETHIRVENVVGEVMNQKSKKDVLKETHIRVENVVGEVMNQKSKKDVLKETHIRVENVVGEVMNQKSKKDVQKETHIRVENKTGWYYRNITQSMARPRSPPKQPPPSYFKIVHASSATGTPVNITQEQPFKTSTDFALDALSPPKAGAPSFTTSTDSISALPSTPRAGTPIATSMDSVSALPSPSTAGPPFTTSKDSLSARPSPPGAGTPIATSTGSALPSPPRADTPAHIARERPFRTSTDTKSTKFILTTPRQPLARSSTQPPIQQPLCSNDIGDTVDKYDSDQPHIAITASHMKSGQSLPWQYSLMLSVQSQITQQLNKYRQKQVDDELEQPQTHQQTHETFTQLTPPSLPMCTQHPTQQPLCSKDIENTADNNDSDQPHITITASHMKSGQSLKHSRILSVESQITQQLNKYRQKQVDAQIEQPQTQEMHTQLTPSSPPMCILPPSPPMCTQLPTQQPLCSKDIGDTVDKYDSDQPHITVTATHLKNEQSLKHSRILSVESQITQQLNKYRQKQVDAQIEQPQTQQQTALKSHVNQSTNIELSNQVQLMAPTPNINKQTTSLVKCNVYSKRESTDHDQTVDYDEKWSQLQGKDSPEYSSEIDLIRDNLECPSQ